MGPISVFPQAGGHIVGCLIRHMVLHRIILIGHDHIIIEILTE